MTAPAERQRRLRRRRRLGILKIEIEVKPETRQALIDAGKLGAWDEDDKTEVERALQFIADDLEKLLS